jgi:hypothetical protein
MIRLLVVHVLRDFYLVSDSRIHMNGSGSWWESSGADVNNWPRQSVTVESNIQWCQNCALRHTWGKR